MEYHRGFVLNGGWDLGGVVEGGKVKLRCEGVKGLLYWWGGGVGAVGRRGRR